MDADKRMTIQQWINVGDIQHEMKLKKTSKKRIAELQGALATWDRGAREHGFADAAAWRAAGYQSSKGFAERHARFLANVGMTAEEFTKGYGMPVRR